jgi:hypothetical protein
MVLLNLVDLIMDLVHGMWVSYLGLMLLGRLGGLAALWPTHNTTSHVRVQNLVYGHLDRTSDHLAQGVRAPSTPRLVTLRSSRSDLRALAH